MQTDEKINIYDQFKDFLRKEKLIFIERFGQYPAVNLKVQSEHGLIFVTIHHIEQKNTLVCFSDFPVRIPHSKRNKIFEFLSVINSQSLISNFILECDGYLRVKSSLYSCENEILSETFRRMLFVNVANLNSQFKKILLLAEINYPSSNVSQNRVSLN